MSEPKTVPGEIARIAKLAGDDPYRMEVLMTLLTLKEADKRHAQWQADHERFDAERFRNIDSRLVNVVSGVGDYNDTKAQVVGAKKLALGIVAALAALGGCILFAIEVIKALKE